MKQCPKCDTLKVDVTNDFLNMVQNERDGLKRNLRYADADNKKLIKELKSMKLSKAGQAALKKRKKEIEELKEFISNLTKKNIKLEEAAVCRKLFPSVLSSYDPTVDYSKLIEIALDIEKKTKNNDDTYAIKCDDCQRTLGASIGDCDCLKEKETYCVRCAKKKYRYLNKVYRIKHTKELNKKATSE